MVFGSLLLFAFVVVVESVDCDAFKAIAKQEYKPARAANSKPSQPKPKSDLNIVFE